jgi:Bacterial protein of unknown function (DUF899)
VVSDFNRELGFVRTKEELKPFLQGEIPPTVEQMAKRSGTDVASYVAEGPGLSAYALSDGVVYRTYVTTARGLEPAMAYYGLLDRTPMGRQEEGEYDCAVTTSTGSARAFGGEAPISDGRTGKTKWGAPCDRLPIVRGACTKQLRLIGAPSRAATGPRIGSCTPEAVKRRRDRSRLGVTPCRLVASRR